MPSFRVVKENNRGELSTEGYRGIVQGIIIDQVGFQEYDNAPNTGNSGNTKPDILQRHARAHNAIIIRDPPSGGDPEVSGRTAIIKSEKDGLDATKSKVTVPLPAAHIPQPQLAYLNQYLALLVSQLGSAAAGGITQDSSGNFVFNPNGAGVPEARKLLYGLMLMTRCR